MTSFAAALAALLQAAASFPPSPWTWRDRSRLNERRDRSHAEAIARADRALASAFVEKRSRDDTDADDRDVANWIVSSATLRRAKQS